MRRALLSVMTMAGCLLSGTANGQASTTHLEHHAPVPCTFLCSYWTPEALGYSACGEQLVPGSYDQTFLDFDEGTRPSASVSITLTPQIDWDVVACTATEPSLEIGIGANLLVDCPGPAGMWGCRDTLTFQKFHVLDLTSGETSGFFVRTFNWSDISSTGIEIVGPIHVTDNSFCGNPVVCEREEQP